MALIADQAICAIVTAQDVIVFAAIEHIVIRAAANAVGARTAVHGVVAKAGIVNVIPSAETLKIRCALELILEDVQSLLLGSHLDFTRRHGQDANKAVLRAVDFSLCPCAKARAHILTMDHNFTVHQGHQVVSGVIVAAHRAGKVRVVAKVKRLNVGQCAVRARGRQNPIAVR